jgi:hypothetical protein
LLLCHEIDRIINIIPILTIPEASYKLRNLISFWALW